MSDVDDAPNVAATQRKRGRPPSGTAMSPSARQARRRQKLAEEGKTMLPPTPVSIKVADALAKYIRFKDLTLGDALEKIVCDRLLRKRSGKRKHKSNEGEIRQEK